MKNILGYLLVGLITFSLGIAFTVPIRSMQHVATETEVPMMPAIEAKVQTKKVARMTVKTAADKVKEALRPADNGYEIELDQVGYYSMIGSKPKGFADFDSFEIWLSKYMKEDSSVVETPPHGTFETNKKFDFKRIYLGKKQLMFETERKHGISYTFSGVYLQETSAENGELPNSHEARFPYWKLRGTLTKLKHGKIVAKAKVSFDWYVGGC